MDIAKCGVISILETYAWHVYVEEPHVTEKQIQLALVLFAVQYLSLKAFNTFVYPHFFSPLRNIPGPEGGNFFLGQTYKLFRSLPGELELRWSRQFPDAPLIRYLAAGNIEYILLNSPDAHREVLQTNCYAFEKPQWLSRIVGEIAGTGLLFAEGDEHKKQRRLLAGPFQFGNIKKLVPIFQEKAKELCSVINGKIVDTKQFIEIECSNLLLNTTLDIIGHAALGYELNSLSTSSKFAECYDTVFSASLLGNLITVIHHFVPIRWALPIKANRDFVNANATIRRLLREHIRIRKHEVSISKERITGEKHDLLTLMIKEKVDVVDPWSEDEILGHLLNFMAAGHETTAGALIWTLHVLTKYPDMQTRLREEIKANIPETGIPAFNQVEDLKFLNNLTREILRYYSPALSTPRQAAEDVTISGTLLPKGTNIIIIPTLPQFSTQVWGSTADQFDPDRFDNLPNTAMDPYAFQAFLSGPRVCIGKAFALLEFKIILIELVRTFDFRATSAKVEIQKGGLSRRPVGGLMIGVRKL